MMHRTLGPKLTGEGVIVLGNGEHSGFRHESVESS